MKVVFTDNVKKDFKKLDNTIQKLIVKWKQKVEALDDPRSSGKALTANLSGLWRYRVGDYRLICLIKDAELIILCLDITDRAEAYSDKNARKIIKKKS